MYLPILLLYACKIILSIALVISELMGMHGRIACMHIYVLLSSFCKLDMEKDHCLILSLLHKGSLCFVSAVPVLYHLTKLSVQIIVCLYKIV